MAACSREVPLLRLGFDSTRPVSGAAEMRHLQGRRQGAAVNEPVAVVALSFVTVLIAIWIAVQVIGGS
jgi:hypothetical protein